MLASDAATRAQAQVTSALRLFTQHGREQAWQPTVLQLSVLLGRGVDAFWATVLQFKEQQSSSGALEARRQQQSLAWMWERLDAGLKTAFRTHPQVRALLPQMTADVASGRIPASTAARNLLLASMKSS